MSSLEKKNLNIFKFTHHMKNKKLYYLMCQSLDKVVKSTIKQVPSSRGYSQLFFVFAKKPKKLSTLCFFYEKSFYKNHEPEIVENLRIT